jgi:hypothetical protein
MLLDAARKAYQAIKAQRQAPGEETALLACEARKECRQAWLRQVEEYQSNWVANIYRTILVLKD